MYCHKCGTETQCDAAYCSKCGSRLKQNDSSSENTESATRGAGQQHKGVSQPPSRLKIVVAIIMAIAALSFAASIIFSMAIAGAVLEAAPTFCLALWLGYQLAGPKVIRIHFTLASHIGIFVVLFLLSFVPMLYTQQSQMFTDHNQQLTGMGIVFGVVVAVSAVSYHLLAKLLKRRQRQPANSPAIARE